MRDPVCGMDIVPGMKSASTQYGEVTYYFCSERCRETFLKDPERYLRPAGGESVEERKIAVVGTGQVGATFAFALMISGLANSIVLIDANREAAEGHALDLSHGMPFVQPSRITVGDIADCHGADIVVVTAGAGQKTGESRLDLVKKNTAIFKQIIPEIAAQNPRIILIVTNPVDVLTYVAQKVSGLPLNRVIGSGTTLDTARFRTLIGSHCGVDPHNIHGYVIGEHGDSEVPVWSQANIGGVPFGSYCAHCGKGCSVQTRETISAQVKNAAYEIIKKKGATYYAVALAVVRIVGSILRDENSVLTVSTLLDGYHGVNDVCMSVPVILNRNGLSRVITITMNDEELQAFHHSAEVLKDVIGHLDL